MFDLLPQDILNIILNYIDIISKLCLSKINKKLYLTINVKLQNDYSTTSILSSMINMHNELNHIKKIVNEIALKNSAGYHRETYGFCRGCYSYKAYCRCKYDTEDMMTYNYCDRCELFNCVCDF